MTATFLINRMTSRILDMKSPCELLLGENKFVVTPKVFGCTCFIRDHRPSVTNLTLELLCASSLAILLQQGYKCWSSL
jgi:hypothetical protein